MDTHPAAPPEDAAEELVPDDVEDADEEPEPDSRMAPDEPPES